MNTFPIIDPEFANKIPPLSLDEFQQLEENILADGIVIYPIITWNGIVVDGHNRIRIVEKHPEIRFTTFEKKFADRFAVLAWICKNQLGRRNLNQEQRMYLIGKQFESEKHRQGTNNQYSQGKSEKCQIGTFHSPADTAERIAKENGIGRRSVYRAEAYSKAVDIADSVEPGIRQKLLSGEIKPTKQKVQALARADPHERSALVAELSTPSAERKKPDTSIAAIEKISQDMLTARGKATFDDILCELDDALDSMIFRWSMALQDITACFANKSCRQQIYDLVQRGFYFFKTILGGKLP